MLNKNLIVVASSLVMGLIILLVGFLNFTERVPEGKVSVVYSPSGGAQEVLKPGWHLIGFFDKTQQYPTRVTIVKDKVSVTTSDGKKITMPVRYEMKVDSSEEKILGIFKELGSQDIEQIQEGYLYNNLFQSARNVVSQYSVLDIYGTKTSEASAQISEQMKDKSAKLGFVIADVTLGTPEVDEETQAAIDARVKAAQENELKKQELENEKIEAEKKKVIAQGEAEKKIIEAEAEAKANKIIADSITEPLLKKQELEARMKHGWVTIQGAQAVVTK